MEGIESPVAHKERLTQMRVKVLFTLHGPSYPQAPNIAPLIRIARLSETVYVTPRLVQAADGQGGDLTLGEVSAKTCLFGVTVSQPELLLDATRDYSLSVLDVVESTARKRARKMARPTARSASSTASSPDDLMDILADSPSPTQLLSPHSPDKPKGEVFEGKGMMRWVMQERGDGKTMLTGRVVKRAPGDLADTLELTLRLTERPAISRGAFVENMRSLANPPATPGNPSPHLNSPSADGFLGRLFRNEVTGRSLGSPPNIVTARAPAPAAIQPPSLPPEVAALIRETMAPNGQTRSNVAPEVMQFAASILQCYGGLGAASNAALAPREPNVVPKKRAALTTQPLPARRTRQPSDEEEDPIGFAHSAGSSLAIRPSAIPSAAKRARVEPTPRPPLQKKASTSAKKAAPIQKICSSCGTTESKRWSIMNPSKAKSTEEREATRMCETCYTDKRPSQSYSRKGSMARSTSSNSVTQSSPPRSIGKRRSSLPHAATSPIRSSRRTDGTATDDDDLPNAPGVTAGRSSLFQSSVMPPSSSPHRGEAGPLPDYILNASPGTALSRIMFTNEASGTNAVKQTGSSAAAMAEDQLDMASLLFSSPPEKSNFDFESLLTSTAMEHKTISAPAPSSSGLTEAADDLHLTSSPQSLQSHAEIFGSPSKWADFGSPGKDDTLMQMMMGVNATSSGFSFEAMFGSMVKQTP